MKITQLATVSSLTFFKEKFMSRWNFQPYQNKNLPCVFFGAAQNSSRIQQHQSHKIVIFGSKNDMIDFNVVKNTDKLFCVCPPNPKIPENIVCKDLTIEIKDYSLFQPSVLGDKIYTYTGFKKGYSHPWKIPIISQIQKKIDFEIITTTHMEKKDFFSEEQLISEYYNKCFLNLNLSGNHGMTTVRELGLMGRKTIMNSDRYKYPCVISYNNIDEIVEIINQEAKKIGSLQPSIDSHTMSTDEWLDTDYWDSL
jgi:hypothetical protein